MSRDPRSALTFDDADDPSDRFRAAKRRAQSRMGRSDLSNAEFMSLLLDVYQLHLNGPADTSTAEEVPA